MRKLVIHDMLYSSLAQHGQVEVISGTHRLTYQSVWERAVRAADGLTRLGVRPGTVVGVMDVNSHRYLELQYALSMVGAVIHTLNFRLSADDLVYTITHAQDEWLFVWEGFAGPLGKLRDHFPNWVWLTDAEPELSTSGAAKSGTAKVAAEQNGDQGGHSGGREPDAAGDGYGSDGHAPDRDRDRERTYESLVREGRLVVPDHASRVAEDDPYSIFYTTGTTGRPKGLRYRQRDMLLAPLQIAHHLAMHPTGAELSSADTVMPLVPFFHIHAWGTAFFPPYLGAKLVLPERATVREQLDLISREGVTWSNMVPTQLHMLLDEAETADQSLPLKVLTGGSQLPSGLAQRAVQRGVRFSLIYGGSDQLATSIALIPRGMDADPTSPDTLQVLATRTTPIPYVDVQLRDEANQSVPRDGRTMGELWVQSPWLPDGYLRDEERSRAVYVDGWFRTGDLAIGYPDGSFYVVDRQKDAVKSGGEWIPTGVLEAVLSEHPAVAAVSVLAQPDEKWGERPIAVVQARTLVSVADLREFMEAAVASGRIPSFWVPDGFLFVDSLPITSTGKIHKVSLRETLK